MKDAFFTAVMTGLVVCLIVCFIVLGFAISVEGSFERWGFFRGTAFLSFFCTFFWTFFDVMGTQDEEVDKTESKQ